MGKAWPRVKREEVMKQYQEYAQILGIQFAYSTNGMRILELMGEIKATLKMGQK